MIWSDDGLIPIILSPPAHPVLEESDRRADPQRNQNLDHERPSSAQSVQFIQLLKPPIPFRLH